MSEILIYPLLSAMLLALIGGPVGCFVAWRRMAFYGDALAHASLLGIAVGLLAGIGAAAGASAFIVLAAFVLLLVQRSRRLASDSLLAILAQTALAGGIVLIYLSGAQVNLFGYLFGDILSAGRDDLAVAAGVGATTLAVIVVFWRPLLLATIHEELAQAEGVSVLSMQLVVMLAVGACVAVGIHIAGVLLMSALLVISPAAARRLARTPSQMAWLASLAGMLGTSGGVALSWRYDLPTGPAIVLALGGVFVLAVLISLRRPD